MKHLHLYAALVELWLQLLVSFAGGASLEQFHGHVTAVVDGDTIKVDGRSIRLEGIDAPELKQPFGIDGKMYVESLTEGKRVTVNPVAVDRYGRIVARVLVGRMDLSRKLVKEGMAWHYREYSSDADLAKLELKARRKEIGLFITSDDDGQRPAPEPPWQYRKRMRQKAGGN